MMNILKKTIEIFITLTLLLVFLVIASPLLPTKKYIATYVVSTGSMEPAIKTGSIVLTLPTQIENLETGQVITFTSPQNPADTIVHRIIQINGSQTNQLSFITKGDNNDAIDNWTVYQDQVLGQAVVTVPYIGYLVNYFKTPVGFIIGIGLPALVIILFQINRIRQGIHEEVEKRTQSAIQQAKKSKGPSSLLSIFILAFGLLLTATSNASALFADTVQLNGLVLETTNIVVNPNLTFYQFAGQAAVGFSLDNMDSFPTGKFKITYVRDGDIEEEIVGQIDNSDLKSTYVSNKIQLATCSGDDCVIHTNIKDLKLVVELEDKSGNKITLSQELELNESTGVIELPTECQALTGVITQVITGTQANDHINGTRENELILGYGGNDKIDGGGGSDCIVGGEGNDDLDGGSGDDIILGGPGNDNLSGGSGDDQLWGQEGNDVIRGGSGQDMLDGGGQNDVLDGGSSDDVCRLGQVYKSCEIVD